MRKKLLRTKVTSILLSGALVFGMVPAMDTSKAVAAETIPFVDIDTDEERKDSQNDAVVIELNKTYSGKMHSEDDKDWYKFTIPENYNGYAVVTMQPDASVDTTTIKDGMNWDFLLYKEGDTDSFHTYSDVRGKRDSQKLPLGPGNYYVKVQDFDDSGYDGYTDQMYNVQVSYTQDIHWEREDNNSQNGGNTVNLNETYVGNLMFESDEDWYRFVIPEQKRGYFSISLGADPSVDVTTLGDGHGWNLAIYKEGSNTSFKDYTNFTSTWTTQKLGFAPGVYYAKVTDFDASGYDGYTGASYNIKVNYTEDVLWEVESNATSTEASSIELEKSYVGNLYYEEDEDWFQFTIPEGKTGEFKVTLKPSASVDVSKLGNGHSWDYEIYQKGASTPMYTYKEVCTAEGGVSNAISCTAGEYQVKVYDNDAPGYDGYTGDEYNLQVNFTESAGDISSVKPKLSKVSAKGKKVSLKWKKVSEATGYKVYRSAKKKGKYSCIKTLKAKTSYVDKKVKKKKTYFYKICAYKETDAGVVTSKYSAIKKVKVK